MTCFLFFGEESHDMPLAVTYLHHANRCSDGVTNCNSYQIHVLCQPTELNFPAS